jgi:hypothetical protein
MAQGGARARSGPPPDPNALRRDRPSDLAGWTTLPAEGRLGDPPEWPLSPKASAREVEVWASEWARPQAVQWERDGSTLEVALYVRRLTEAEAPGAPTNLGTLVKQLMEGLGISQDGLARRRWKIAADQVAAQREASEPAGQSARDRFKVVTDVEPGA